jgi:hypothetical protein
MVVRALLWRPVVRMYAAVGGRPGALVRTEVRSFGASWWCAVNGPDLALLRQLDRAGGAVVVAPWLTDTGRPVARLVLTRPGARRFRLLWPVGGAGPYPMTA